MISEYFNHLPGNDNLCAALNTFRSVNINWAGSGINTAALAAHYMALWRLLAI